MSTQNQVKEILKTLDAMIRPGQVVELRIPWNKKHTDSGYFDDMQALANAAYRYNGRAPIYFTPNPVKPDLLSRAANRVQEWMDTTTSDKQIVRYHWLLIDADPKRESGISASEAEHEAALQRIQSLVAYLTGRGWPEPIYADSGNGAHANYCIDLPNDEASTQLVRRCLLALDLLFSDDRVTIDTGNFNPSRIWKLYGTKAIKGDDTPDRPHRWAEIITQPDRLRCVSVEQLQALADLIPTEIDKPKGRPASKNGAAPLDVPAFMAEHGLTGRAKPWQGGTVWVLDVCPFNEEHTTGAYIAQLPNGAVIFGCHHNSDQDKNWQTLKALYGDTKQQGAGAQKKEQAIEDEGYHRREIEVGDRQLADLVDEAEGTLIAENKARPAFPLLYRRGGKLCRIVRDEDGGFLVQPMKRGGTRKLLSDVADWINTTESNKGPKARSVFPPLEVVDALLDAGEWPRIPAIASIVSAPTFAKDGTLITAAGYNAATRCFNTSTIELGDTTPTPANVEQAKALILDDLLIDFPFPDAASRAHAVAYLLLPFVRNLIDGQTPLHLFSSPDIGSGKGLLLRCLAAVALGHSLAMTPEADSEEEWRKRITSSLMGGASHIAYDNITHGLTNASLATALTEPAWRDRVLQMSADTTIPISTIWAATGTNVAMSVDIARRVILIRLDPEMEKPWQRSGFKHTKLMAWVMSQRGALVTAALTMIRHWFAKGQPNHTGSATKGSYEAWVNVIGGILEANGIEGFLANEEAVFEQVVDSKQAMEDFVAKWFELYANDKVSARDLFKLASHSDNDAENASGRWLGLLDDLLGAGNQRSRSIKLGNLLEKYTGRVVLGHKITDQGKSNGARNFALTQPHPKTPGKRPTVECSNNILHTATPENVDSVECVECSTAKRMEQKVFLAQKTESAVVEGAGKHSTHSPHSTVDALLPEVEAAKSAVECSPDILQIDPTTWVRPIHNPELWHISIEQALDSKLDQERVAARDLLRWLKGENDSTLRAAACIDLVDSQLQYYMNGATPPQED